MHKAHQQRIALRVALYVLRKNGFIAPPKRQVLNFIRMRGFLRFPDEELQKRWESDSDEIWENDIAWRRKDLDMDGEIWSPERGKWQLTDSAMAKIENGRSKWLLLTDPNKRKEYLDFYGYLTDTLFEWMVKIGKGDDLSLKK